MDAIQIEVGGKIFTFANHEDPIIWFEGNNLTVYDRRFDEDTSISEVKTNDVVFPNYIFVSIWQNIPREKYTRYPSSEIFKDKNGKIKFCASFD